MEDEKKSGQVSWRDGDLDGGGCGRGGKVSDLPEGGCPGHLLHLRSNGRLAQALHGEAGEGQCGDGVQEVQDHCSPGAGYGGHPADEQEEKRCEWG